MNDVSHQRLLCGSYTGMWYGKIYRIPEWYGISGNSGFPYPWWRIQCTFQTETEKKKKKKKHSKMFFTLKYFEATHQDTQQRETISVCFVRNVFHCGLTWRLTSELTPKRNRTRGSIVRNVFHRYPTYTVTSGLTPKRNHTSQMFFTTIWSVETH